MITLCNVRLGIIGNLDRYKCRHLLWMPIDMDIHQYTDIQFLNKLFFPRQTHNDTKLL